MLDEGQNKQQGKSWACVDSDVGPSSYCLYDMEQVNESLNLSLLIWVYTTQD